MKTENSQNTVLIIGAAGNFGAAVAPALVAAGHRVRALRRVKGRAIQIPGVEVIEGDALNPEDVARAAEGVDAIVHAFNVPYPEWDPTLFEAARVVAEAAARERALIVLPGNVYGLDPADGHPLSEGAARANLGNKSAIRNKLEDQLIEATEQGSRLLIVRAGDYLGPGANLTWFHEMTKKALAGGALSDPGMTDVLHDWAYLPDIAAATVRLIERRDELSAVETFHFTSFRITSRAMLEAVNARLDRPRPIRAMPWWLLRPVSVFVPMLRELFDMKYLWEQPVLLDDGKLQGFLGDIQRTPLSEAVGMSLGLGSDLARDRAA